MVDATRQAHPPDLPLPATLRTREPPAEERVLQQEGRRELRQALAQLPPAQREVILLRFGAGWSCAAVGQQIGRSEGAVKLLQHRGLQALLGGRWSTPSLTGLDIKRMMITGRRLG